MIFRSTIVDRDEFNRVSGWTAKPDGLCKDDRCVPVSKRGDGKINVGEFATRLGMPVLHDEKHGLYAVGPESGGNFLKTAECPEIVLPDLSGKPFAISSLRGQKVVLVAWASWCGCSKDLPIWQKLREELHPRGLEIVTVAMDTGGAAAAEPYIKLANPTHPSLIDEKHVLAELLGVVNVPFGVWIDEKGMIVRPPELAPGLSPSEMVAAGMQYSKTDGPAPELPPRIKEMVEVGSGLKMDRKPYQAGLRDWVEKGSASEYALSPEEVVRRSAPRPADVARAAAAFELAQHLQRTGHPQDAITWFKQAHRLQPDNWTYRRQAWSLLNPLQGPTQPGEDWPYDGDWLTDLKKVGVDGYYNLTETSRS